MPPPASVVVHVWPPARIVQRHALRGRQSEPVRLLPQGRPEAKSRVLAMVEQMDKEGFGNCSNTGACEVECPKGISLEHIARMNREYLVARVTKE